VEFDILEASDSRTKRKLLQTMGERSSQFKSDLTRKWALAADQDEVEDTVCEKYDISKEKWAQFCRLVETLLGRYVPCHLSCFSKTMMLLYFILPI